jgi:DNA-binding transcriptional MerR regulator
MNSTARLKIGEVSRRTGLTARALRYYEEIGLLEPSGRLAGGHRVYTTEDLRRLYRICLLRQLGTPLATMAAALDEPDAELSEAVDRHLSVLDDRLAAVGRLRERVRAVSLSLRDDSSPTDSELLALLEGMSDMDAGICQRLTLLVYDDIEAVHDHLVTVFGFGPGQLSRDASGRVVHGELHVGDGVVWMHPASEEHGLASPASLGAATHCMAVMVDDVDAHHARATRAGADIVGPPRDMDYGVREYDARDIEGGLWSFMTTLDEPTTPRQGAHHG